MPAVTYDAQSLMVDGRRVWLVSGTIEYSQIPRGLWRRCLRAARGAGLNCICTRVPWNRHEPKQGSIDFTEELDLRHFIELAAEERLYCIVRPGPYVGGGIEGGGLPAWLSAIAEMKLREASRPFLDACTRWFRAVMAQVRDLQITSERNGGLPGPIILMQIEQEWFCHNNDQAHLYLGELIRYLREEGCQVPLIEANNCWQSVEGAFATWHGADELASNMRQFRVVQRTPPLQNFPLLVSEYPPAADLDPQAHGYQLAQALAAGAQFNVEPVCAAVYFGCLPERGGEAGAPVTATGDRRPHFYPIKRLATFANQFGQLFAHLHADQPHAATAPSGEDHPLVVLHQEGTQGDVVFIFKSEADASDEVELLMPDGQMLPVPLGEDRAAWIAFNVNLGGVARLTYTNLRPWAFLDQRLLVLFGPAGAPGIINIDGSPIAIDVPKPGAAAPEVFTADAITVAVLSDMQVDASCVTADGLIVGTAGLDDDRRPLPHRAFKQPVLVSLDGAIKKLPAKAPAKPKPAPRLGAWSAAPQSELTSGASEAYQPVAPGSSLDALDAAADYGWYRLSLRNGKPGGNLLAPAWADRVHVFAAGKPMALVETAACEPFALKGVRDVVLLTGSAGRAAAGWRLGEPKGLAGHLYQVKQVKLAKAAIETHRAPDPSAWRSFLPEVSFHHHPHADAWAWTIKPMGRQALIVRIKGLPRRVLLMVDDRPVGGYDPDQSGGCATFTLEVGNQITGGRNAIRLALFERDPELARIDPRKHVAIYDAMTNLTAKAEWAFAPWTVPGPDAFTASTGPRGHPCWFRTTFGSQEDSGPLWLELRGMSAGSVLLNGRAIGRYAPPRGKADGAAPRLALPAPWLSTTEPNVLLIFDEQGRSPRGCRLTR